MSEALRHATTRLILFRPFSGVYDVPIDRVTDDGFDLTFGVNIVGW